MPYSVAAGGGAAPSQYSALTLWPGGGVISTARDFAKFDVALKNGVLITPATRSLMWQAPTGSSLQALPHGVGWFVQSYKGELVAWQFGMTENASSALVITLPARGLTLILLANSDGLVKPFALTNGDVAASPFGRVFLGFFVP
jgi:CubicO group peptidase (beta-lactamase class C family)